MKRLEKIIFGLILTPIILYAIFYLYFAIGMIDTNSKKPIPADIVLECVTDLKNRNKDLELKNLELYYQQGRIHTNIYFENNLSLDESKIVMKSLNEFILKDSLNKYFSEKHMSQLNIRAVFYSKDNSYYYNCPYYLYTNDNSTVKNNGKTWYLMNGSSTGKVIEAINID